MRLEHHLVGEYVRYICPHIIIITRYTLKPKVLQHYKSSVCGNS